MSKKIKILLITIILLIVSTLIYTGVRFASATINGKTYSSDGGDYYNAFGYGHCSNFWDLKYNNVKNKYYGSNIRNDYAAYIVGSRDAYCLNENTGTGNCNFYVADIVDIDGHKITFAKSDKTYYGSANAAKIAYAIYQKFENPESHDSTMRNWMTWGGGWKRFYNEFKEAIGDTALKGTYNNVNHNDSIVNPDYANMIKNFKKIKDNNTTKPTLQTGKYKKNGKTYQTKMGPYSLVLNKGGDIETKVICIVDGKEYNGIVKKSSGKYYFYFLEKISATPSKITVKQSYTGYKARLILLGTGADQCRLIGRAKKVSIKDELEIKTKPTAETNVSLQKYITKVNGNNLTDNETVLINRKNTYSRTDETNAAAKRHPNPRNIATSNYKLSNAVQIEAGDKVTYRIYVYNNSTVTANKVEIIDKLLYYNDTETQYSNYQIVSITRDGGNRNIQNEWTYVRGTTPHQYKYTINNLAGGAETYFDITVKLNTYLHNTVLGNTAYISGTTPNNTTDYRTLDRDYIKMKPYKVSLQKIVDSVNGNTSGITSFDRWSSWESNENKANKNINTYKKHNQPVTVGNGDYVTYAIKVRNDGQTIVKNLKVKDILPQGLSEYKEGVYSSSGTYTTRPNNGEITLNVNRQLNPGQEFVLYITAKVSESNMSTRVLANKAEILNNQITNKNDVVVTDTTPDNNQDADYIQLKDITIAGTVWNDKALDKKQDNYNGLYDEGQENKLEGIKVKLLRTNSNGQGYTVVADTKTDSNGNYKFDASMIYNNIHVCERHMKASYQCSSDAYMAGEHQANYWKENSYYSYIVQFVYDGITYTSTVLGNLDADNYTINSNASENEYSRKYFNDQFATINKDSGINYTTKNEEGYIPQSRHIYDENKMAMNSNAYVSIATLTEDQLQHINLGLRGRDIFDLELTSDVDSTKVTVNGQSGEYHYNSNKVTVRKSDIDVAEDAANFASETREGSIGEKEQAIRTTDLDINKANENATEKYAETGLGIEVTYKITVTNASRTDGTATNIINYYDSRYTCVEAHIGDKVIKAQDLKDGDSGKGFKSKIIPTQGTNLTQGSDPMVIYVVYTLNTPANTLADLVNGNKDRIPTYNMAEIYEYTTKCGEGQTEFTRGLIDKDSAPGSANQEQVRTKDTEGQNITTNGNPTTVQYYFGGNDLSKLKYEDDTYATPTLYFTSDNNSRTLSGFVFRDKTDTNHETRIKTGDGVKDKDEEPVYGATIELVELNDKISPEKIANNNGKVRYTTTTKEDGSYTFSNFLPGNYVVRYHYGDTTNTVLLKQSGEVNKYSFNGEDYQSTNNIGTYGAKTLHGYKDGKFTNTTDWYAYNEKEGVSTGIDNTTRRKDVSKTVTNYTDEKMIVLNNVRDHKNVAEAEVNQLIADTNMYSTTPRFTLTVEKTVQDGENSTKQNDSFADYSISNMNFGIAEVPVTTIDLQKHVAGFTIKDSAGDNTIASLTKQQDGTWKTTGDILPLENAIYDVSIEDEKLQGAKLEVTYEITSKIDIEKNFDGNEGTKATITEIADYIDNDLSYNEALGENSKYWEVTSYDTVLKDLEEQVESEKLTNNVIRKGGYLDREGNKQDGSKHANIIKTKQNNPILKPEGGKATITLEKTLSAEETTVEDIITSSINTYEYDNNIEIIGLKYENTQTNATGDNFIFRDRVRRPSRNIILAGSQYDGATSETITIHPPTGDNNNMMYYIIAIISLGVLATGIVFIKKYAIKK